MKNEDFIKGFRRELDDKGLKLYMDMKMIKLIRELRDLGIGYEAMERTLINTIKGHWGCERNFGKVWKDEKEEILGR